MDLDGFKAINDQRGHLTGDYVLRTVGDRIEKLLRASDTVARLGGDEFAFVLPTVDRETPETVAEKIMNTFKEPITMDSDGEKIDISGSIGIALYPDHGLDVDTLIGKSDAAMYKAKRAGNNICVHNKNEDSAG
jgi:diguanylate cyclase (GGDEF)-like protein